jgi:hypothetical protein
MARVLERSREGEGRGVSGARRAVGREAVVIGGFWYPPRATLVNAALSGGRPHVCASP